MLLAIDPGNTESAFVVYDGSKPVRFAKLVNDEMLAKLRIEIWSSTKLVIEMIGHYGSGMPAGQEIFDTCIWIGRFVEAWNYQTGREAEFIKRQTIKAHLCGSARAKDPSVRQALIDRWGGADAIGKKKTPGPLYGVSGDVWAALAVAVTCWDQRAANAS